ncbi:hypothetical protein [Cellulomonas wangsupingiae]|uniref:Histidine kinase n=1 Tax=Cellulomonas wangsupingiae TaxID=2968085 RepID=A0ABY5K2T0_9CELL|nr:hypothetical protein [Cellulomonas wangsupingiae]MCC2335873.1 hypothetical protein [Cellulomonas wangsupingiae]MCM0639838.1 hypothetical protein [Cellulomonas wangsupingiae]UUI64098.1 hypothetical protein NP075_13295 [Cellulomonas wangsupingiae]
MSGVVRRRTDEDGVRTVRRLLVAWVAGTVTYLAALVAGALLLGVLVARSGAAVTAWPVLVVPGLLAGAVSVLVVVARAAVRPARSSGLVAVAVPAVVALVTSLLGAAEAAARADVAPLVQVLDVAVPVLVLLATGAAGGALAHVRWSPPSRSTYAEVV